MIILRLHVTMFPWCISNSGNSGIRLSGTCSVVAESWAATRQVHTYQTTRQRIAAHFPATLRPSYAVAIVQSEDVILRETVQGDRPVPSPL